MAASQEKTTARIISREVQGCVVIGLIGGCDDVCASSLGRVIDSLIEEGRIRVVLDLSRANYIESSGFRLILEKLTKLHEVGGQLVVTGLHGSVGRAFGLLKLDRSVPVAEDVNSALLAFPEREEALN